jgi:hypothetical protein
MALVVEHMPSKHRFWVQNPSTAKKKKWKAAITQPQGWGQGLWLLPHLWGRENRLGPFLKLHLPPIPYQKKAKFQWCANAWVVCHILVSATKPSCLPGQDPLPSHRAPAILSPAIPEPAPFTGKMNPFLASSLSKFFHGLKGSCSCWSWLIRARWVG